MAPRPGTAEALRLWGTSDAATWKRALQLHAEALRSKKAERKSNEHLVVDDCWLRKDFVLEHRRSASQPGKGTSKSSLERVVRWKLAYGKWRPLLKGVVSCNSEATVSDVFEEVRAHLVERQYMEALKKCTVLHNVGPATATAILAPLVPNAVPFMADEALECALDGERNYKWATFERFRDALLTKQKQLGDEAPTLNAMSNALWVVAQLGFDRVLEACDVDGTETESAASTGAEGAEKDSAGARKRKRPRKA